MFVAALTDYDECLYENASVNRLQESLDVFESLQEQHTWQTLLILNKMDLFKEKYGHQKIPLNASGLFPHAPSSTDDINWAIDWIAGVRIF